jgi:hypothetical protein
MLRYKDIASMLGHAKTTTMWEQWQIAKGNIAATREESARDFYNKEMMPSVIRALQARYSCRLGDPEVRTAHEVVSIQACPILDLGNLPISDASHLFVKSISSEGYSHLYGYSNEPYLVADAIRASLIRAAFKAEKVAMFLFVASGEQEHFITIPNSNEVDDAVAGVIEKFNDYVARDEEPEPDYAYDAKALMAMAGAEERTAPTLDAAVDEEFVSKVKEYESLRARQSVLDKESREIKKQRDFLGGFIGARLRGFSRAYIGPKTIEVKNVTRNVAARIDQYSQINIKD